MLSGRSHLTILKEVIGQLLVNDFLRITLSFSPQVFVNMRLLVYSENGGKNRPSQIFILLCSGPSQFSITCKYIFQLTRCF